jgi:peptidoglycan hydrolase-like protein with peptidoglycan-binding domain
MRPGRQRPPGHAVALDGIFGPQTDAAVKAFQTSKGLTANGTVDPTTWKALIVQVKKGASGDAVRGVNPATPPKAYRSTAFRPANRRRGARISTRLSLDIPSVAVDGIVGPITWQALVSGMLSG